MFNSRLFSVLLIGCLFVTAPMSQASVFGAIAKIFKGSDEAAQVAGKSDEAAAAMKAADETTHAADDIPLATKEAVEQSDDMPLATKETVEHSDDMPLASKEDQPPITETVPEDSTTEAGVVAEDGSIIEDIAKEAIMQTVGAANDESVQAVVQAEEEEQEAE